jgi:hypothetical protein
MGYSLKTATKQLSGVSHVVREVGVYWAARGLIANKVLPVVFGTGNSLFEQRKQISPVLRNRENEIDPHIRDILKREKGISKEIEILGKKLDISTDNIRELGFIFMKKADAVLVSMTWEGSYQRFLAEMVDKKLPHEKQLELAVAYADTKVLNTQPSSILEDVSPFSRQKGILGFFTFLQSWRLKSQAIINYEMRYARENTNKFSDVFTKAHKSEGQLGLYKVLASYAAEAYIMMLIMKAIFGKDPEDEDYLFTPLGNVIGNIPVIGQLSEMLMRSYKFDKGLNAYRLRQNMANVAPASIPVNILFKAAEDKNDSSAVSFYQNLNLVEWFTGIKPTNVYRDLRDLYYNATGQEKSKDEKKMY